MIQPNGYDRIEHDDTLNSKNVKIVGSTATIYAVVNTGAAGGQASVVVDGPVSIKGNVTLSDSKSFIGLTTTVIGSAPTIYAVVNTQATAASNVTLDPGSKTGIVGNVTLSDSKTFIGLVTVGNTVGVTGTFYQATQPVSFGNVTMSDSKNFIGLTTVVQASSVRSIIGNITLSDPKGYIGLVTIGGGTIGTTFAGNVTLDPGSRTGIVGNVTISDSKGFIGLTTTVIGSSATIYAVVNTSAAGVGQSIVTVANPISIAGNITISSGSIAVTSAPTLYAVVNTQATAASNVTLDPGSKTGIVGNVTLSDSKTFIGLVTVGNVVSTTFSGNVTLDAGSKTQIAGNVTLSNSQNFIGLVTVVQSSAVRSLAGNVTITSGTVSIAGNITINAGSLVGLRGNVTLDVGSLVGIRGNLTLSNSQSFIGLVTVVQSSAARTITGNVTISDSKTFIGLVTAWTQNAGTTKTLIPIPVALSSASQATIAVPATNLSIYVTSLLLSSNATVRVSIKSGVTYLTGNASIGITLNPGGGWVETGAPDAPIYRSTPSASINIEKFDMTGTIASLAGKVVYYTE
jgi:hypothetical protein